MGISGITPQRVTLGLRVERVHTSPFRPPLDATRPSVEITHPGLLASCLALVLVFTFVLF